jgi:hypothetical protein
MRDIFNVTSIVVVLVASASSHRAAPAMVAQDAGEPF